MKKSPSKHVYLVQYLGIANNVANDIEFTRYFSSLKNAYADLLSNGDFRDHDNTVWSLSGLSEDFKNYDSCCKMFFVDMDFPDYKRFVILKKPCL